MKERPILFSSPMVRAILDGKKTQTRRIVKLPPAPEQLGSWEPTTVGGDGTFDAKGQPHSEQVALWHTRTGACVTSPYGVAGDRLWVRETHAQFSVGNRTGWAPQCVAYRASCAPDGSFDYVNNGDEVLNLKVTKWTPAIYMPHWASRITLEVTAVRVERLQDISEPDAMGEGIIITSAERQLYGVPELCAGFSSARHAFGALWETINGDRASWASNPWVWVVSFRRMARERAA